MTNGADAIRKTLQLLRETTDEFSNIVALMKQFPKWRLEDGNTDRRFFTWHKGNRQTDRNYVELEVKREDSSWKLLSRSGNTFAKGTTAVELKTEISKLTESWSDYFNKPRYETLDDLKTAYLKSVSSSKIYKSLLNYSKQTTKRKLGSFNFPRFAKEYTSKSGNYIIRLLFTDEVNVSVREKDLIDGNYYFTCTVGENYASINSVHNSRFSAVIDSDLKNPEKQTLRKFFAMVKNTLDTINPQDITDAYNTAIQGALDNIAKHEAEVENRANKFKPE